MMKTHTRKHMNSTDWAKTPLGPIEERPQSLRTEEQKPAEEFRDTNILQDLSARSVGVCILDVEGNMIHSNHEMRRFLPTGIIPSRDAGRSWRWRAWHPDGRPVERNDFPGARALRGESVLPGMELLFTTDDGMEIWTRFTAEPLIDDQGKVTGAFCVVSDINAFKRAEDVLRESEARFRALVLANSSMLYQMSADWSEIINLKGKGTIADIDKPRRHWLEIYIPSDEQTRVMETIHAAIRTKSVFELEHRVIQTDGREGWVFSCAVPLLNSKGEIIEWFGAATDITERKHIEQTLKETDRRKDEFLAVLAHELRNPLFPIKNAIYLLQHTENHTPNNQQLIQMMDRQVNHIVRLVDDLLEASRIATGKIELRKEMTSVVEVINNAIEVSKPLLDSNQHQLTLSLPVEPLMVNADIVRMTQVFANLLNNAAKYTPKNGVITVNATLENKNVVISVRDNGVGISAEMLPNVFEMFAQDKHTVNPDNRGLGVGLAMVRSLVELHEGTVKAYSAGPNRGSEFIVRLPLEEGNKKEIADNKVITPEENFSLTNLRVLIVDDNLDITNSLAMLLNSWEVKTHVVNNGKSALAALDEFIPHIILLDIGMPDMDGYEVAEKIRQNPQYAPIQLVALTGWSQEKDRLKSRASGFNEHLAKPVDINVLKKLLSKLAPRP